jgi:hypothetical protein
MWVIEPAANRTSHSGRLSIFATAATNPRLALRANGQADEPSVSLGSLAKHFRLSAFGAPPMTTS